MFPVRCFTCGRVLASKWTGFLSLIKNEENTDADALDIISIDRICCRRLFLTYVPIEEYDDNQDIVGDGDSYGQQFSESEVNNSETYTDPPIQCVGTCRNNNEGAKRKREQ